MTIKVLFYRYGSICEPDILDCFRALGIDVTEETGQIRRKDISAEECVRDVAAILQKSRFAFVFSVNFFPAVSECCELFRVPYVSWVVDCPVMELFSPALKNGQNRVFLFDRAQYAYFRRFAPAQVFHLPLATNTARWDKVIRGAAPTKASRYASDVSFVGSLYSEKNPFHSLTGLSDYMKGFLDGLTEAQMKVYGYNFTEDILNESILSEADGLVPEEEKAYCADKPEAFRYLFAHKFLGSYMAETERKRLLNHLAAHFAVDLYTRSDTSSLKRVRVHGGVQTLTEMPLVFHGSKINLNITMRPIQTGLSLRLFDICGAGGFLLTNYQEELGELYEPGVEAECFASEEELLDKVSYYLTHEEERCKIAERGYLRTRRDHTYEKRIGEMIRIVYQTL